MKRLLTAAAASLLLTFALVAPVGAKDAPGCSAFGHASGGAGFGQMISGIAPRGAFPLIGTGTYRISDIVAWEHSDLVFGCAP